MVQIVLVSHNFFLSSTYAYYPGDELPIQMFVATAATMTRVMAGWGQQGGGGQP